MTNRKLSIVYGNGVRCTQSLTRMDHIHWHESIFLNEWIETIGRDEIISFSKNCILFSNYPNLSLIFILIGSEPIDEIKFPYEQKDKKKKKTNRTQTWNANSIVIICLFFFRIYSYDFVLVTHLFMICINLYCVQCLDAVFFSFTSSLFCYFSTNYFGTQSSFERFV